MPRCRVPAGGAGAAGPHLVTGPGASAGLLPGPGRLVNTFYYFPGHRQAEHKPSWREGGAEGRVTLGNICRLLSPLYLLLCPSLLRFL